MEERFSNSKLARPLVAVAPPLPTSGDLTLQITKPELEAMKREIVQEMVEALWGIIPTSQPSCQCAQEWKALIPKLAQEVCRQLRDPSSRLSLPDQQAESCAPSRTLYLHFDCNLPADGLFTFVDIQDHEGAFVKVELRDGPDGSGSIIKDHPEFRITVEIYAVEGDLAVPKPRPGKPGELLKGKCKFLLSQGVAKVSDIAFTDNSKTMRNSMFRFGARAVGRLPPGVAVKDGVSEAFRVKERRTRRQTLSLTDGTQCLKHIGDALRQKLAEAKILASALQKHPTNHGDDAGALLELHVNTVQDFLQLLNTNAKVLQDILQISKAKWSELLKSYESCPLTDKGYKYDDEELGVVLILDCVFNIVQVKFKGPPQWFLSYGELSGGCKELVDDMRCTAYLKRKELPRIGISSYLTSMQGGSLSASRIPDMETPYQGACAATPHSTHHSSIGQDGYSLTTSQTLPGPQVLPSNSAGIEDDMTSPNPMFGSDYFDLTKLPMTNTLWDQISSSSYCEVQDPNRTSNLTSPSAGKRQRLS